MITRIEIDGFKTFLDFSLDLAPFQVIIGPNGSGKSNLFDAIGLLSLMAKSGVRETFKRLTEETGELFAKLPHGKQTDRMQLAVELLVEHSVEDELGSYPNLLFTRLRYEISIVQQPDSHGLNIPQIIHERLISISPDKDEWLARFGEAAQYWQPNVERATVNFISTTPTKRGALRELNLDTIRKEEPTKRTIPAYNSNHSLLSVARIFESPHVAAARQEMKSWRLLQLNEEVLRQPSDMLSDSAAMSPDGSNMPTIIDQRGAEYPDFIGRVSRDMANMVPGFHRLEPVPDEARHRNDFQVIMQDGRRFWPRELSDGTLRLLALATLKNDPEHQGVLMLEEPENGVHPGQLKRLVRLLHGLATDLNDPKQAQYPLRQLLINTHSPEIVNALNIEDGELVFAETATRIHPGVSSMKVTRMTPVRPNRADSAEDKYALARVIEYLNNANIDETRANLREALLR